MITNDKIVHAVIHVVIANTH